MCIIATTKVRHDYNPYNVYFTVCLPKKTGYLKTWGDMGLNFF